MLKPVSKILVRFIALTLIITLNLVTSMPTFLQILNGPTTVFAADNQCTAAQVDSLKASLSARVGGVSLDQAATFLANMSDVKGAYYDATLDRIVFVGQVNTSIPQFNKDDLAVAIRAVIFNNTVPQVSIDPKDPTHPDAYPMENVTFSGGIEDTNFGSVLLNADYTMKQYAMGYDQNQQRIRSSVPGYKSVLDMFVANNPDPSKKSYSRWWISPQQVTLKKDDPSSSFVFDSVKMQVLTEGLWPTNDPAWNQAAQAFAQNQTDNFDLFAAEIPSYYKTKQLAKIVSVVKWIKDNNIATDFTWAKNYQPNLVPTPREVKMLVTPSQQASNGTYWNMYGGVTYATANTYNPDNGTASGMKSASQAVPTTKQDVHWTFTQGGTQYDSVAVAADAFRSLGAYATSSTDMSFPTMGNLALNFQRVYSSFAGSQLGIGRGWDMMPARLTNTKPGWFGVCNNVLSNHPWKLALDTMDGKRETFTFNNCTTGGYGADDPSFHSSLIHNSDGTFTITLTDQTQYIFDANLNLIKVKDEKGNMVSYNYSSAGQLASVADAQNHSLNLSYNSQGLISALTDWSGRTVGYGYDTQSDLTTVTDPKGGVTTYGYDSGNNLTTVTDPTGQVQIANTYTPEGKVATQKDSSGKTVNMTYNNTTKTISLSDNLSRGSQLIYDDKARVLQNVDPVGKAVISTYGTELAPLSVTDKNGNKTTYTYDASGNLTSVTYPNSKKITYTYDAKNHPISISDDRYKDVNNLSPKVTSYTYDGVGNLTKVTEGAKITSLTYTPQGEIAGITNPLGKATSLTRDSFGNILTLTDPLTGVTSYQYDGLGRLTKKTDPDGKFTNYSYDADNNLNAEANADGTNQYGYTGNNQLLSTTLPTGAITSYNYNSSGSLNGVTDALSGKTTYAYDQYQNLIQTQDALNRVTTSLYDSLNRQTQITTPLGNVTNWTYDANGNITQRIDSKNQTTSYAYDNLNRLTKITYPNLTSITFTLDDRGNITKMSDPTGTTTYNYDLYDRLIKSTNPYGQALSYSYDSNDNLTKITYPDGRVVNYSFDSNNHLAQLTDWNGKQTGYTYNKNGQLSAEALPNGISASFGYDGAGQLLSLAYLQNAAQLVKYTYGRDGSGNILQVNEEGGVTPTPTPTPTPTASPTPTPTPTPSVTPSPTPTPLPTPTPSPSGTPSPSQPDLIVTGLSISPTTLNTSTLFTITSGIKNQGGAPTTALSFKVSFYYDRATAPTTADIDDSHVTYFNTLAAGQADTVTKSTERFSTAGNHNIWVIIDSSSKVPEGNEVNNVYGPFNVAVAVKAERLNLLAQIGQFFKNLFTPPAVYAQQAPGAITTFAYDLLGRITSAKYPDNSQYGYSYDKVDNRLSQTLNSTATSYNVDNDNELTQVGSATLAYDKNGNLTTRSTGQAYTYDFENRLISFKPSSTGSTTSYTYDGLGNRIQKSGNATTRFVNDTAGSLSRVMAETNNVNTIQNYYIYGAGMVSQGTSTATGRVYPLYDGQGNIRLVTDSGGNIVRSYNYDPYGNVTGATGTAVNNYQFSGEQSDPESSMYFLRARYYDPAAGRFITRDPIKGILAKTQSLNAYQYAYNDPVNLSDPSGKQVAVLANPYVDVAAGCVIGISYLSNPSFRDLVNKAIIGGIAGISTLFSNNNSSGNSSPKDSGSSDFNPSEWIKNNFNNPNAKPGPEWEWRGPGSPSDPMPQGGWYNPETGESLHPDINNAQEGPHWDYNPSQGDKIRFGPDGKPL